MPTRPRRSASGCFSTRRSTSPESSCRSTAPSPRNRKEREMGRLEGKVAIITGSAGGQGRAAAILFAREGARIVGCDVGEGYYRAEEVTGVSEKYRKWTAKSGPETVEMVQAEGGEMVSMEPCDLTTEGDAQALVRLALDTFGRVDILYNNAAK